VFVYVCLCSKCYPYDVFFSISDKSVAINRDLLSKAHYMMRPFFLRRIKSEVECTLPIKLETKINCPMTRLQRTLTQELLIAEEAFLQQTQIDQALDSRHKKKKSNHDDDENYNQLLQAGALKHLSPLTSSKRLLGMLTQLRKVSNHPFLFPNIEQLTIDGTHTEEIVSCSGKMIVLDKLLKKLYLKKHRVVLFSQFTRTLDIISDYLEMRAYRHSRLDGSTNRVMREVLINLFNRQDSEVFVFLLSTRAGGEGVNLHTADTVILFDSDWNPQVRL
jgi:SWI/SNF-related matrix-associated actin-dependent regulator of chromatin subfamily A member 5